VKVDQIIIIKNIRMLKNSKACGLKGRYAEMVKNRKNKLYRIITTIMNQCLNGENGQGENGRIYLLNI